MKVSEIPKLKDLSSKEEDLLEKKIIWVISHGRSGSTWLTDKLLRHPDNIIWNEPFLGYHLGVADMKTNPENDEITYERIFERERDYEDRYIFAKQHEINWLPAFRKFFLTRTYSQARTLEKNIIIKEPTANISADLILQWFPNSKFIFLLRNGRDVIDSRIAAHGKNTWLKLPTLNEKKRMQWIKVYSYQWNHGTKIMQTAYQNFNQDRRIFVKYENLRKDTVLELKKIYDFLEIKIGEDELKKIVDVNSFENIPNSERGPEKFNRGALVNGWKKKFSEDEQNVMNSIMGDLLKQFGYEV